MMIARQTTSLLQCLLMASIIFLSACGGGGGGGGSKNPPPSDTTPNAFSFATVNGAEPGASVTSAVVTISGINTAAPVTITGGEYSIAGAAFVASAGTISNGQSLAIRLSASDSTNTTTTATVTVGGVSATFSVTTLADTTPAAFSFAPVTNATLSTDYTATAITVSGIDIPVAISITGGLYSINGGAFTAVAGTVAADDQVSVKLTSAATTETASAAELTIGGVTGSFSVTTVADTIPPVAEFKFPTPYTMSEAMSVKVRGTASDDHAVTSVVLLVNGTTEIAATPVATNDYSSWTASIPLTALSENEIKVIATDDRNNTIPADQANKVVIRQAEVKSAFPDNVNAFGSPGGGVVQDHYDGRNRLLVADGSDNKIKSVDLETGERSIFTDLDEIGVGDVWGLLIVNINNTPVLFAHAIGEGKLHQIDLANGDLIETLTTDLYERPRALVLDEINGDPYLVTVNKEEFGNNALIAFSLNTETFSTLWAHDEAEDFKWSWSIALDNEHNRYLISKASITSDATTRGIYSVNKTTGERSLFSTNAVGSGENFSANVENDGVAFIHDIVIDTNNNRLLTAESATGKLFAIDLDTAHRTVIANFSYLDSTPFTPFISNMMLSADSDMVVLTDFTRNAVLMVDLETGQRVILSKSANVN